jgi:hypothetical protein
MPTHIIISSTHGKSPLAPSGKFWSEIEVVSQQDVQISFFSANSILNRFLAFCVGKIIPLENIKYYDNTFNLLPVPPGKTISDRENDNTFNTNF